MSTIGYGYGSEWHLLRYLGYHRDELNRAVTKEIGAQTIEWLDFPHSSINARLQDDQDWLRLDFLNDAAIQAKWKTFWPSSGKQHHWDAVAKVTVEDQREWLLVEAKAHVKELKSSCQVERSSSSGKMIENALDTTRIASGAAGVSVDDWLTPYYQYANRLAALYFLNSNGVPARLLNIYFIEEVGPTEYCWDCPVSQADWEKEIRKVYSRLGLTKHLPFMARVHNLFPSVHPNAITPRLPWTRP